MCGDDTMTMPFDDNQQKVLEMLQIDIDKLQSFNIFYKDNILCIDVKLKRSIHQCPVCSTQTSKISCYTIKKIKHSILSTAPCIIYYHARRYICPVCHKTFYEDNPFCFNGEHSSAATVYCVLSDLKAPQETFKSIGERYHISPSTVVNIFDRHVSFPRHPLPRILSIDEVYVPTSEGNKYLCVLMDFESMNIVDVLPSRKKHDLINYFSMISREERCNVEMLSADMWVSYHDVARIMLPSCQTSVDKFHLLMELSKLITVIRVRTMKKYGHIKTHFQNEKKERKLSPDEECIYSQAYINYYALKKFNWLFFTKNEYYFDANTKKRYNKVFHRYMNYLDIYDHMIHCDPELEKALFLKDDFESFYAKCDYDNASSEIDKLISDFRKSDILEMKHFAGTLAQWKKEIVSSFIPIDEKGTRINNSRIESINKKIKTLKRCANGYRSFDRLRNRIIFCCNKDAKFSISPIPKGKEKI